MANDAKSADQIAQLGEEAWRERGDRRRVKAAAVELVLAIAHEIGNFASAVRLQAHLLDDTLRPVELAAAAVEIDELGARQGVWLGLLRPLLAPMPPEQDADVESCIAGVADALRELGQRAVKIETDVAPGLPRLAIEPQLLHQIVILLVTAASEAAQPAGQVRLSAARRGKAVVVRVADDGPGDAELDAWQHGEQRGRVLRCLVADLLARGHGGHLSVERRNGWTTIDLEMKTTEN